MNAFDRAAELFEQLSELPRPERGPALEQLSSEGAEVLTLLRNMLSGEDSDSSALDEGSGPLLAGGIGGPRGTGNIDGALPESIGPYRILGLLGEGGMGRVFEAQQSDPERRVALKVIRGPFASEEQKRRFATEAQALAWLNHPGIATVFESGTAEVHGRECPYLALERVEGEPLDSYLANHSPALNERVQLIARICDAVHHAHQKGVVHRDLKPANVLVDRDGRPKVLDFGIARLTDTSSNESHTATGALLGTLAYMSPEQFKGSSAAIDARSDVYALGVLLFEALCGQRPFKLEGLPLHEAAQLVTDEDAPLLSTLEVHLRGDLETIAAKALESERGRRYPSAADLAADLRRFLEHEPIEAVRKTTIYKLRKFTRRNRWIVAGTLSTFLALVAGLVGTASAAERANGRAEQATLAREHALQSGADARAAEERALTSSERARAAEREALSQARLALAVRDLLLRVLNSARPSRAQGREITVAEAVAAADREVSAIALGDPQVELEILLTLTNVHSSLNEFERAVEQSNAAVALAREQFGEGSLQLRRALRQLGNLYASINSMGNSERALREVLAGTAFGDPTGERELDVHDYVALGHLSAKPHRDGDFELAIEMSERSVAGLRGFGDEVTADLAVQLRRLSGHYMFTGDRERELLCAEEAYERAVEFGVRRFGRPLLVYEQYANALDDSGRSLEAVEIYRETLDICREWYGVEHHETWMLQFNLALALSRIGEPEEALLLLEQSFRGLRRTYGPSHRETMLILRGILTTYAESGQFEEGLVWSDPYVDEISDEFYGWLTLLVRGQMLLELGLFEDALEALEPTYPKVARSLPLGHSHLTDALRAIVASHEGLGQAAQAQRYRDLLEQHAAAVGSQ